MSTNSKKTTCLALVIFGLIWTSPEARSQTDEVVFCSSFENCSAGPGEPQFYYLWIHPDDFHRGDDSQGSCTFRINATAIRQPVGPGAIHCALTGWANPPDKVEMHELQCLFEDNRTDMNVRVNMLQIGDEFPYPEIFSVASVTGAGVATDSTPSEPHNLVDNSQFRYLMQIIWEGNSAEVDELIYFGCRLKYTIPAS